MTDTLIRGQTREVTGFTLRVPGKLCLEFAMHLKENLAEGPDPLLGCVVGDELETAWSWSAQDGGDVSR
jgi:hypothetical protein